MSPRAALEPLPGAPSASDLRRDGVFVVARRWRGRAGGSVASIDAGMPSMTEAPLMRPNVRAKETEPPRKNRHEPSIDSWGEMRRAAGGLAAGWRGPRRA